ncbi:PREDICTED: plexin-B2-like, partial [Priapulus caudatus]|uniref:Plexin-B2-like n=1 Tax=Priapulus caudatus TaxID=37621 RepID=A0ABM1F6H0_PRICU
DSPSNKLLYAKDIPKYKGMVNKFYSDIHEQPPVSDQDMNSHLTEISRVYGDEFNTFAAVSQLYGYVVKYHDAVMETLEEDHLCQKLHLAHKLDNVALTLEDQADMPWSD